MAIGAAALVALAAASGQFELPVIAADGTRAGVAADGRTAVLAERPAHGVSRFALVDAKHRRVERVIKLRGDYSFDAISPDAATIYFVHYRSRDHTRYAIQAMDASDRRARLTTVVEKGEPGERMSGLALTRVNGPGGWIYTLYDGAAGHAPFIHALSSEDRFTICIDLDPLAGRADLASLRMKMADDGVRVLDTNGTPLVRVNPGSYEVTPIATSQKANQAPKKPANEGSEGAGPPRALIALALAAAIGVAVAVAVARATKSRPPKGTVPYQ
jgi:hypothetical protein